MHSSSEDRKVVGTDGLDILMKKLANNFIPSVLECIAMAEQCLVTSGLPQNIRDSLSRPENAFPEAKIGDTSQGQLSRISLNMILLSDKFRIPSL